MLVNSSYEFQVDLGGQGIVLVPSAFGGGQVLTMLPPLQPMIIYPRLLANRPDARAHGGDALAALIGPVRAAVLRAAERPTSTSDIATLIGVSPSAVSQHAAVLRGCGLLTSRREGKRVLHFSTPTGDLVLNESRTRVPG